MIKAAFPQGLEELIKLEGSKRAAAARLGITHGALNHYLRPNPPAPSLETAIRLVELLGGTAGDLAAFKGGEALPVPEEIRSVYSELEELREENRELRERFRAIQKTVGEIVL